MRFRSYLNSAITILQSYNGNEPFHLFIKKYFSVNKKYGSKDRKQITSLCYNFFRLGKAAKNISAEEKILLGTFLCENKNSELLKNLQTEWNDLIDDPLQKKISFISSQFSVQNIFPLKDELSREIDAEKFNLSFLIQPQLFLRIRPNYKNKVLGKLLGAGIPYELATEDCITLSNSSKINDVLELDREAVVQDYNSQRIGEFLKLQTYLPDRQASNYKLQTFKVWDCCAASGGKSIMAYDIIPNIELTVSDKRASILNNLQKRFAKVGIQKYNSFVADITFNKNVQTAFSVQTGKFDLIICDAPCTGSGTWARTPEQLYFFKEQSIKKYAVLQKKILENIIPHVKPNGQLLYITCSVFKKENEDVVNYIKAKYKFKIKRTEILKGYEMQADTMFAALLIAPTE
ncbi:MAG: methyltransferase domain-containing protein [Bacteroidota bacterium]|nr:methyltransferase domain-containing protein [Bacteroidota bacterium]